MTESSTVSWIQNVFITCVYISWSKFYQNIHSEGCYKQGVRKIYVTD